jgi:CRISPR/Cas system-associated endoribonuclease Cas2
MKPIETKARKKRFRRNVRTAMLTTIGIAGIISIAAIAPNMFQILGRTGALSKLKYQSKGILTRLKLKGEIELVARDGKKFARLTDLGEKVLAVEKQKISLMKERPKKWDRRYRLIMFDIPEKRRQTRDQLRYQMQEVGFLRVQDSAWVYPYDCEEFVALLKADLHIGKDVLYAVIEEIENDKDIRKHFNLPAD